MNEILANIPWTLLPATCAPLLVLLAAPLCQPKVRTTFALLLAAGGLALCVLAAMQAGGTTTLEIINPFFDATQGRPVRHVVERVSAPAWQWPLAAAAFYLLPALVLWLRRDRAQTAPQPALYAAGLGITCLLARLALEKSAAPSAVVWGTGMGFASFLIAPFVGWYAAARSFSFAGLVGQVLVWHLLQRGVLVALAWWFLTGHHGTHLDVHTIEKVDLPLAGPVTFGPEDDAARWMRLMLIPQLLLWGVQTLGVGIVLGGVAWRIRRRRPAARGDA